MQSARTVQKHALHIQKYGYDRITERQEKDMSILETQCIDVNVKVSYPIGQHLRHPISRGPPSDLSEIYNYGKKHNGANSSDGTDYQINSEFFT